MSDDYKWAPPIILNGAQVQRARELSDTERLRAFDLLLSEGSGPNPVLDQMLGPRKYMDDGK